MSPEDQRIVRLRAQFSASPSEGILTELVTLLLRQDSSRPEARELCFRALREDHRQARVRLLLAKAFYLDGMWEFALRELEELSTYAKSPVVSRLLEEVRALDSRLRDSETSESAVVAEIDLDDDLAEALSELEDSK